MPLFELSARHIIEQENKSPNNGQVAVQWLDMADAWREHMYIYCGPECRQRCFYPRLQNMRGLILER